MKLNESQFTRHDGPTDCDDEVGFDLCIDASEMGVPPGTQPPAVVTVAMADGSTETFDCCCQVVDKNDTFMYWSYFNEAPEVAINLKVFND